jgi:hypothetical protein
MSINFEPTSCDEHHGNVLTTRYVYAPWVDGHNIFGNAANGSVLYRECHKVTECHPEFPKTGISRPHNSEVIGQKHIATYRAFFLEHDHDFLRKRDKEEELSKLTDTKDSGILDNRGIDTIKQLFQDRAPAAVQQREQAAREHREAVLTRQAHSYFDLA